MTPDNSLTPLLAAPLSPDWTVDGLAEQVLGTIAAQHTNEPREFVLDGNVATDQQSRRLLRPLLACLATKSAAEARLPVNLYSGRLSFHRPGPIGSVWIVGEYENRPGVVRVALRCSASPPEDSQSRQEPSPLDGRNGRVISPNGADARTEKGLAGVPPER